MSSPKHPAREDESMMTPKISADLHLPIGEARGSSIINGSQIDSGLP